MVIAKSNGMLATSVPVHMAEEIIDKSLHLKIVHKVIMGKHFRIIVRLFNSLVVFIRLYALSG